MFLNNLLSHKKSHTNVWRLYTLSILSLFIYLFFQSLALQTYSNVFKQETKWTMVQLVSLQNTSPVAELQENT